jgi:hypothetical protein
MTNGRAHARWLGLAAALALLGVGALALGGDGVRDLFRWANRAPPVPDQGTSLEAGAPESAGPRLEGARRPQGTVGATTVAEGPVNVTVSDRQGRAVVGLRVFLRWFEQQAGDERPIRGIEATTDARGHAVFAGPVPYDGTREVLATARGGGTSGGFSVMPARGSGLPEGTYFVQIDGPESGSGHVLAQAEVRTADVALEIGAGLPLDVTIEDAADGRTLAASWKAIPRLEWELETSDEATVPVDAERSVRIAVEAIAPRGTVLESATSWNVHVHPRTQALRAVVPARPEADVVAVFPPDVLPFRDVDLEAVVDVGGRRAAGVSFRLGAEGRLAVRGLPHLSGETVTLGGALAHRFTIAAETHMPDDPGAQAVMHVTCTRTEQVDLLTLEPVFRFRTSGVSLPVLGGFQRSVHLRSFGPTGILRVRVRLPSGAPAAGALVRIQGTGQNAIADAEGWATLSDVAPDWITLLVDGAGAAATRVAQVTAGETTEVEIRTSDGGSLEVEVVDARGRALPYAALAVTQPSGLAWMDVDGDVQRIDPYTDVRGKRTLRTVEPGPVKVKATYGSRTAEVEVEAVEDRTARVRIVLPVAGAPPTAPLAAAGPNLAEAVEPVAAER